MISRCSSRLRPRSRHALRVGDRPLSPNRNISPSQSRPRGFPFVGDYANDHILMWALAPTTTNDARDGRRLGERIPF
jgi:hypothetical protein